MLYKASRRIRDIYLKNILLQALSMRDVEHKVGMREVGLILSMREVGLILSMREVGLI